jgi:tetratricopeptide (TPR) repeat protein
MSHSALRIAERLLAASVGVFLVAWCLREDVQPDLYFHFAAGRWILENGLPHTNVFLAPNPDHPFVAHEWLFQVACWPLYQLGGAALLTVLKSLTVAATFAALAAACRRHGSQLRWLVLAAALVVAGNRFILRPEVVSLLGVALHVAFLTRDRGRLRTSTLVVLPLAQVVWSNAHGFSILGPVLVGGTLVATLAHAVLARRWGRWSVVTRLGAAPTGRDLWRLGALLGLECFASILNPYGLEAALYPVLLLSRANQEAASAGLSYRVVELVSPFAASLRGLPEIRLYLAWLALAPPLYLLALWRGRVGLQEGVIGGALAATSVLYLRNLPFAAIGLVVPTVAGLGVIVDTAREALGRTSARRARVVCAAVGVIVILALTRAVLDDRFHTNASYDARPGLGLGSFPRYESAVEFLEASPPPGGLYNNFGAGHFLIYARDGKRPLPSLCGNVDLYPRSHLRRYHEWLRGERPLGEELDRQGISDVLLDHRVEVDGSILRGLLAHPDWVLVHADSHALIFRRARSGQSAPEALDVGAFAARVRGWQFDDEEPDRFGATRLLRAVRLLPTRRLAPLGRLNAARLLELLGAVDAARELASEAAALAPDSPLVLRTLADLEQYHGDPKRAAKLWAELAVRMPRDPLPLVKQGLLALKHGRPREAVRHFQAATARDPDSQLARENLLTAWEVAGDPVELRRALAATKAISGGKRAYFLGSAAHLEGDLAYAEEHFAQAVERDPQLIPAWSLLAQVLGERDKLGEAEAAWARLGALSPRDGSVWRALGETRRRRLNIEGALRAWGRAIDVNPSDMKALLDSAEALLGLDRPKEALGLVRRVLDTSRGNKRALRLYERATLEDHD